MNNLLKSLIKKPRKPRKSKYTNMEKMIVVDETGQPLTNKEQRDRYHKRYPNERRKEC